MSNWIIFIIVIAVILVVLLLIFSFRKKSKDSSTSSSFRFPDFNQDKGERWERIVSAKIRMALEDNEIEYKLYNDLYLPNRIKDFSKVSEIDHLLITKKNIYIIESKAYDLHENNQLIGNIEDEHLYLYNGSSLEKKEIFNPLFQNKNHIRTFRNLFSSKEIKVDEINNIVIMKTNYYNRTSSKYDPGIVDDFYTLDVFIQQLIEIEKDLYPEELINSVKRQVIINTLDEIESNKSIYRQVHKQENNY